jgi:P-type Ca2+ transporter type 2C
MALVFIMSEEFYQKTPKKIFELLETNEKGLSQKEAEKRLEKYGYNEVRQEKTDAWYRILLRQFKSLIVWILIAAAVISLSLGKEHLVEFYVIMVIIGFIILINFFEEYKAAKEMESLVNLSPKKSSVLRDGKKVKVLTREITIGDILILDRGDIVGADARLISSNNILSNESALTGESLSIRKNAEVTYSKEMNLAQRFNMVYSGTQITNGDGIAVVVKIGEDTEIGKISKMLKDIKADKTPLQKRLDVLTKQLSLVAFVVSVVVFFIGLFHGAHWSQMLLFSMAVIVSGIPESLPTVVVITLAVGVKKMADNNAIVKRLTAVETLGTCSVICSDKTGTLTQNKMVVENIFTLDAEVRVTGKGYDPEGLFFVEDKKIDAKTHKTVSKLLEIGVLCNNAELKKVKDEWEIDGEATEAALIVLGGKAGYIKTDMHQNFPRKKEHPFDPVRKSMSTIHLVDEKSFVYSKGAPESMLEKATHYYHEGNIKPLTNELKKIFFNKNEEYAKQGLRVLGLAFKEHKGSMELHNTENNLVFVGLVSIRDPPEPAVKEAIEKCESAGIKVVMITGDNENTGVAVAKELGIFKENDRVLTGSDLENMDNEKLIKIVEDVSVYARVTPEHKLRIVDLLQQKGHIVAMTGDGVNDAPALKKAEIGIAMGRCGTDVARESSDLILKDDNFKTIVTAVEGGRTIYENIRKFIYYLLVGNMTELLVIFIAVLVGMNLPLTALMVFFINLVTSEFPAIGLGMEKPTDDIMKQKPRSPKEGILNEYVLLRITELLPLTVLGTIILFMWMLVIKDGGLAKAQTIAFAAIIFFELFHALNAKSWRDTILSKKIFSNIYVLMGILLAFVLTLAVIYIPYLQGIFGTVPLTLMEWVPILMVSLSILVYREIQKTILSVELKEIEKMKL